VIDICVTRAGVSLTCATNGVTIAPIRAMPLQMPRPSALIVVG